METEITEERVMIMQIPQLRLIPQLSHMWVSMMSDEEAWRAQIVHGLRIWETIMYNNAIIFIR